MAKLDSLLSPTRIMCRIDAASKKRIFELAAQHIANADDSLAEDAIYAQLLAREKLGSTGLGEGVAIPHCRVTGCEQPLGCIITLATPVNFESPDNKPVDLLFVLLVPTESTQNHLDILAEIASRFSRAGYCDSLRQAQTDTELLALALHNSER